MGGGLLADEEFKQLPWACGNMFWPINKKLIEFKIIQNSELMLEITCSKYFRSV